MKAAYIFSTAGHTVVTPSLAAHHNSNLKRLPSYPIFRPSYAGNFGLTRAYLQTRVAERKWHQSVSVKIEFAYRPWCRFKPPARFSKRNKQIKTLRVSICLL